MKNKATIFLIILFSITHVFSQQIEDEEAYLPVIPHTPSVNSLNKYKEVSVSKNSGLPNIEIPVTTIQLDDLTIPVYLSYHAGGIRVNEVASWVGQGWNLIAGGSITRTVRHLHDDHAYGFIHVGITTQDIYDACVNGAPGNPTCRDYAYFKFLDNKLDFEPDIFSYNAPGISGSFTFNQVRDNSSYGEIKSFPISENKIIPYFTGKAITKWDIIDTNGNTFTFEVGNVLTHTESFQVESNGNLPQEDIKHPYSVDYTQTWNLTKITTYKGKELYFNYSLPYEYETCSFSSESQNIMWSSDGNKILTYVSTEGTEKYLTNVSGDFGSIDIATTAAAREDYPDGYALDEIIVTNLGESLNKRYKFKYFYTTSSAPNYPIWGCKNGGLYDPNNPSSYDPYRKRMFLEEIEVFGDNVSEYKYTFDYYNENLLPHRNSYAQDYWGYYNGANDNTTLLLNLMKKYTLTPNRQVNEQYGRTGLLKRIYYPEGGYTEFEYESNKALVPNGTVTGFRMVPSDEKVLQFDTFIDTPHSYADVGGGYREYYFKKYLIINNRTFNLRKYLSYIPNEGKIYYAILDTPFNYNPLCSEPGQSPYFCIQPENSMPQEGDCSFWVHIQKTTLSIDDYEEVEDIDVDINNVQYDNNPEYVIEPKLLFMEEKGLDIKAGIYVVEFVIKTQLSDPIGPCYNYIDIEEDRVKLSINYRTAKKDNNGIYDFDDVQFNSDYTEVEIPVGGQRIKRITEYKDTGQPAKIRNFYYRENDSTWLTSGKTLRVPYFIGIRNFKIYETSMSSVPLITTNTGLITYTRVIEEVVDVFNNNLKMTQINTYSHLDLHPHIYSNVVFPYIEGWRNGLELSSLVPQKLYSYKGYSDNFLSIDPLDESTFLYGVLAPTSTTPFQYSLINELFVHEPTGPSSWSGQTFYRLQYGYPTISIETTETYFNDNVNNPIITTKRYYYESEDYQAPTKIVSSGVDDITEIVTKMKYPHDSQDPTTLFLVQRNRIAVPYLVETYKKEGSTETLLSTRKVTHHGGDNEFLPEFIQSSKGNNSLETRLNIEKYDNKGNVLQASRPGGAKTTYLWGYKGQYLVAKIEGATYAQVTGVSGLNMSVIDNPSSDSALQTEIDKIRVALTGAMVTTYTYKPLVGVSSITDPKGDKIKYVYDGFGKLNYIEDNYGNKLEEYEYHYRED